MTVSTRQKALGCLWGLALGDALGAPVEFLAFDRIKERWPPNGPEVPLGNPIRVTDDTQMSLAVARALERAFPNGDLRQDTLEQALCDEFVSWAISPDNNRAPGRTCMDACEKLQAGEAWQSATVPGSKGCGANMRAAPAGLLALKKLAIDDETIAGIAQLQAAITHGHPTGLAAAELTALIVAWLAKGMPASELLDACEERALGQREIYRQDFLDELWRRPGQGFANASEGQLKRDFIARGWDECRTMLANVREALREPDFDADPCEATGAGWIAEEALATALFCFLLYPDEPVQVIRRAAASSGDSDSIACIAGAFAGAACGADAWPREWVEKLEYADEYQRFADFIVG